MSKPKAKALIFGIAFMLVACLFVWILRTKRDASSANEFHARFVPDPSFRGQILVSVIERETGPERRLAFLIDLDRGEISASPNEQPSGNSSSAGGNLIDRDCAERLEIPAPDHELSAHCAIKDDRFLAAIRNLKSNTQIREWSADRGWTIGGLVWSANSKSIAVLVGKGRTDLGPIGLLSGASGHPISLNTFKVFLLSNQLDHQLALPVIRKDSPSGWARIDWVR